MGRRKLNSELISNERSRMITFHKRKKGLIKKVEEFQILCNVKVCVIIFSPKLSHHHRCEVEAWPSDPNEVKSIIDKYRNNGPNVRSKKNQDLSDYFITRKNKVEHEIAKVRKAINDAKFSKRCDGLNLLSYEGLWELNRVIDAKLKIAERRLLQMRSSGSYSGLDVPGSSMINQSSLLNPNSSACIMFQNNMDYEFFHDYSYNLRTLQTSMAVNENRMDNPMLRQFMDGEDYARFYGATNNNHNLSLVPLDDYSYYNNNSYASMVDSSSVFRNPEICYRPMMQPRLPYMEVPSMLSASSQIHSTGIVNLHQSSDEREETHVLGMDFTGKKFIH